MKSNLLGGVLGAAALACLSLPTTSLAGPVLPVTGTTSGVYTNPKAPIPQGMNYNPTYKFTNSTQQGQTGTTTSGSGTNFQWGTATSGSPGRNQLWWNANDPLAANTEEEFKLGTLTYFNGTTAVGSNPGFIDLKINLTLNSLDGGSISPPVSQDFIFTLKLVSTTNDTGTADGDADYVYLPSSFSTTTFTVDGTEYTLKLTGFGNVQGNGFVGAGSPLAFHVHEGKWASADLMGVITSEFPPDLGVVPEPASVVSAAVAGLAGLAFAARRRRRNATA